MHTAKTLIRRGGCPADLSLRWAHMPFCWFCHEAAHLNCTSIDYFGMCAKMWNEEMGTILVKSLFKRHFCNSLYAHL